MLCKRLPVVQAVVPQPCNLVGLSHKSVGNNTSFDAVSLAVNGWRLRPFETQQHPSDALYATSGASGVIDQRGRSPDAPRPTAQVRQEFRHSRHISAVLVNEPDSNLVKEACISC